ncbi:hypothetical protein GEMRC1_007202 [Eukaryota sp. GEM-RC1]
MAKHEWQHIFDQDSQVVVPEKVSTAHPRLPSLSQSRKPPSLRVNRISATSITRSLQRDVAPTLNPPKPSPSQKLPSSSVSSEILPSLRKPSLKPRIGFQTITKPRFQTSSTQTHLLHSSFNYVCKETNRAPCQIKKIETSPETAETISSQSSNVPCELIQHPNLPPPPLFNLTINPPKASIVDLHDLLKEDVDYQQLYKEVLVSVNVSTDFWSSLLFGIVPKIFDRILSDSDCFRVVVCFSVKDPCSLVNCFKTNPQLFQTSFFKSDQLKIAFAQNSNCFEFFKNLIVFGKFVFGNLLLTLNDVFPDKNSERVFCRRFYQLSVTPHNFQISQELEFQSLVLSLLHYFVRYSPENSLFVCLHCCKTLLFHSSYCYLSKPPYNEKIFHCGTILLESLSKDLLTKALETYSLDGVLKFLELNFPHLHKRLFSASKTNLKIVQSVIWFWQ